MVTGGLRNAAPTVATITGILTDPNFRVVIHALEQRTGTENLAEPEVTTISGRQTQMRATDILTIITSFSFQQGTGGTTTTTHHPVNFYPSRFNHENASKVTSSGPGLRRVLRWLCGFALSLQAQVINNPVQPSAITPNQQAVEVGPVLDVIPYVLSDGYTINLTLIPSLTEFAGYITPPTIPGVNVANVVEVPTILPNFTVRQVITTVNIWDNQTVVLGGLISSQIVNHKGQGAGAGRSAVGRNTLSKPVQGLPKKEPDDFCDRHHG